ncbi:DUF2007 domain-containing protein [Adhaeribacter arboris]|uniref:DUF2007 domain-containing protein n=1 Tax=Adhaeribacter arboris TaxID=2072846 RepID=A0A2T2YIB0_9BACT|nr:DUF2007 domain-containing protein [Adhaeribacter arboris]PSR55253.1 DUF2007 domain-containing protein [Adhaeribacter arboris]
MANKLMTIATFPDAVKAQIMRGRLEAEGIPAFIADEHTLTNQPYLYMAYGGVRLQVMETDQERALAIIQTREPFTDLATSPDLQADQCPNCHSRQVEEVKTPNQSILTFLRNLFTSGTTGIKVRRFNCRNCGYNWIMEL